MEAVTLTSEERFRSAFADNYADLLRFAQRRVDPHHAEDVAAEAFLAAWRRVGDLPDDPSDARAWLFGIVRNCLLNDRRSARRRDALAVRLADASASGRRCDADEDFLARRVDVAAAWASLPDAEQEVLALAVLDGLTSAQAGAVLGIRAAAFRLRLSRARAALRVRLDGEAEPTTPTMQETRR